MGEIHLVHGSEAEPSSIHLLHEVEDGNDCRGLIVGRVPSHHFVDAAHVLWLDFEGGVPVVLW